MPELPEVESIRRNLIEIFKGDEIIDVFVHYRPIVSNNLDFESKLKNQKINDIERQGKYLKFILDDYMLISHLRMEGKYFTDYIKDKHTHVEFLLKSGHKLSYHDTRKFGRFELVEISKKDTYLKDIKSLAPDPHHINKDTFKSKIIKSNKTIKELLLDQSVIGGIGNIYANEILYLAKIHPSKKGFMINDFEIDLLIQYALIVLDKAILMGGSSIHTFESLGERGLFQQELNVHGKKGSLCNNCHTPIVKYQLKGRGTYYCPNCQKSHVIALTGGIASGKSTAVKILKKKGLFVIDTDEIVKNLYKDESISQMIAKKFDAFDNEKLDKQKLANIIFNDKKKRTSLEKILHPLVFQNIDIAISDAYEYINIIDMPLLFETNYKKYDESLLIYVDNQTQLRRLMERNNFSKDEALLRINSQISLTKKQKLADYVINNSGTIKDLELQLSNYFKKY